jgi:hypothetical protein
LYEVIYITVVAMIVSLTPHILKANC